MPRTRWSRNGSRSGAPGRSATSPGRPRPAALDLAGDYLERAREALVARTEWFAFQHAHVGLAEVELRLATGSFAAAATAARAGGDEQRRLTRPFVADFEYLEGEAHRLRGDLDLAAEALGRARATTSALGGRRILRHILISIASVEEARGNATEAAGAEEAARIITSDIEESLRPVGLADRFRERVAIGEVVRG